MIFMAWGSFDSSAFGNVLYFLDRFGIFEYFLPFMIYFLIIYGLLGRVDIFNGSKNEKANKINVLLAASMSLLILYYVPTSKTIGMFLSEIFTKWGVLAITLLLIPLTLAILGIDITGNKVFGDNEKKTIAAIILILIILIFYGTLGSMFREYWYIVDPNYVGVALLILLIAGAILYVGMEDKSKSSES